MTTQDPGGTRPARAAGLMLMGIAVIAAVLGVITLIEGGAGNAAPPDLPPTSSTANPPGTQPSGSAQPSSPTNPPPTSPPPGNNPTTEPPPQPPPPPNPRDVSVRVFNNGTIPRLAAQAANDFRGDGWNVVEVGNYPFGIIPTSTVYFRTGTEEEAAARELGGRFNLRVEPRFEGIVNSAPGLIVIVTNDYGGK
ncbi:MAG TPA: LytR C-terminal domain-containing protein [Actinophytocola sp.]|uniref:LytR C-terminal domain-containing protein n=1 Tax=Actinophytocola sp. TaxID=1872138 RepID=UPI002DDD59D3|nr:LytR C-terminal domain-containing protein [Actinophytocola sp.]HEV2781248.1 LytR C-terminal domain-containing protein [Actinophytocola sp.]